MGFEWLNYYRSYAYSSHNLSSWFLLCIFWSLWFLISFPLIPSSVLPCVLFTATLTQLKTLTCMHVKQCILGWWQYFNILLLKIGTNPIWYRILIFISTIVEKFKILLNSQYFWKWTNANPMKIFRQPASHPKLLIGSKLSLD